MDFAKEQPDAHANGVVVLVTVTLGMRRNCEQYGIASDGVAAKQMSNGYEGTHVAVVESSGDGIATPIAASKRTITVRKGMVIMLPRYV